MHPTICGESVDDSQLPSVRRAMRMDSLRAAWLYHSLRKDLKSELRQ